MVSISKYNLYTVHVYLCCECEVVKASCETFAAFSDGCHVIYLQQKLSGPGCLFLIRHSKVEPSVAYRLPYSTNLVWQLLFHAKPSWVFPNFLFARIVETTHNTLKFRNMYFIAHYVFLWRRKFVTFGFWVGKQLMFIIVMCLRRGEHYDCGI